MADPHSWGGGYYLGKLPREKIIISPNYSWVPIWTAHGLHSQRQVKSIKFAFSELLVANQINLKSWSEVKRGCLEVQGSVWELTARFISGRHCQHQIQITQPALNCQGHIYSTSHPAYQFNFQILWGTFINALWGIFTALANQLKSLARGSIIIDWGQGLRCKGLCLVINYLLFICQT